MSEAKRQTTKQGRTRPRLARGVRSNRVVRLSGSEDDTTRAGLKGDAPVRLRVEPARCRCGNFTLFGEALRCLRCGKLTPMAGSAKPNLAVWGPEASNDQ